VNQGVITPEQGAEEARKLPGDPAQLRSVLMQKALDTLEAGKRIDVLTPKIEYKDTGKQMVPVDSNGFTNRNPQALTMTPTPGQDQSFKASMANVGLGYSRLAEDKRQFGAKMEADKEKKATDASKPLPPGALKMQQEALDAIGVSSSINADLSKLEEQVKSGKLKFGPLSNITSTGLNMAGMSTENSRNFSTFKSSLERLRNESLRLNTGVQTDGDAQRAWNELFSSINDTELVKQRLAEIQAINKRGAELQKLKVDSVRANYGKAPIETAGYESVPAAVGAANKPTKPAGVKDLGGGFTLKN
jgi:hypothetical protein